MDAPSARVKGEGEKTDLEKIKQDVSLQGRAGSVFPLCRRGRKKLKIPFSFFPQGRQQRERRICENGEGKK